MLNNILKKINLTKKINRQEFAKFLVDYKSTGKTLDIGAGFSPYDCYYKENFPNRTVLDIKPSAKVDVVGDIHHLPFKNNEFDNVLCFEVFEHLKNPWQAVQEIKRVLKPDGRLILSTRFIAPLHDTPNDYFRFTKYGLQDLFKDWKIQVLKQELNTLATLAFLYQRLGFQTKPFNCRFFKLIFFIASRITYWLSKIPLQEYGNIKQTKSEKNILTSGYYLVACK